MPGATMYATYQAGRNYANTKAERNMKIIQQREDGATFTEIGREHNICAQRAREIYFRYVEWLVRQP